MKYLIGIDDTDNLESKGTGHRARMLGLGLMQQGIGTLLNITRHQLFVSPLIPYTSHNSSASLVFSDCADFKALSQYCRDFLLLESAVGSDAGLCIAEWEKVQSSIIDWGRKAKQIVLQMEDAYKLATDSGIYLEGLTGTKCGIIGSLAAVGLRREGNDGRLLWMRQLRETEGVFTAEELKNLIGFDEIADIDGRVVASVSTIHLSNWSRPVLKNGKITLIVQQNSEKYEAQYISAPKEYIKHISG